MEGKDVGGRVGGYGTCKTQSGEGFLVGASAVQASVDHGP